jgi:DUF4097 and DUF4098 domain-containing protein YvlB
LLRPIWLFTLAAIVVPALPSDAQVYPERVRSVTRTVVRPAVERYQRQSERATETERITRTLRLGASGDVEIGNIAGDITITRGNGSDVVIEAIKTSRARTAEEAKAVLPLVEVDISERAGRVEARTRYPRNDDARRRNWRNVNVSVAFNVTAPERARISVNTISGNISVRDIKGDLTLETISGNVQIGNAGRVSKAKTVSGSVDIADTTMEGMLSASTISGIVQMRNVKARQIELGSISGSVLVDQVTAERVDAQSISGDIKLTGPLVRGGRYDLGSHSGTIEVVLTGDVGFEIEASSFSGNVRTDLPLKLSGVSQTSSRGRQRSIRGTYGDGSAFLDLTTFSGSVVLGKK